MNERIYDLVIQNGDLIDFNQDCIMKGMNIGIQNGKIQSITRKNIQGNRIIDATDKIISPGFIDFHSHVDGKMFSAECIARQGGTTTIGGERSFDGKVIRKIQEEGFLINHGFYISHSFTLRTAAGIKDPYKVATSKEIEDMVFLAEKFLKNGAYGIHFGLEFVPGTSKEELLSLSAISKKHNRVILVHLRKDGKEALNCFDEIIHVARNTKVSVHILHLMYMVGFKGVMGRALEIVEAARKKGYDITADSGLYSAFPTCIGSSILDPGWEKGYGCNATVEKLLISSGIYSGQFCNEKTFRYLREEFPSTLVTAFVCDEEEIINVLKKPYVYVSTNAADGPHYENIGHPETSGTFPRLIGRYARDKQVIDLIEAIKKITLLPAQRFGIQNKGKIEIGFDADIVIFDYQQIIDTANFVGIGDPNAAPKGIEYVIVNGEIVVEKNKVFRDKKPGKLLKHCGNIG